MVVLDPPIKAPLTSPTQSSMAELQPMTVKLLGGSYGTAAMEMKECPNLHFSESRVNGYVAVFKKEAKVTEKIVQTLKPPTAFAAVRIRTCERMSPQCIAELCERLGMAVKAASSPTVVPAHADCGVKGDVAGATWKPVFQPTAGDHVGLYRDVDNSHYLAVSVASPYDLPVRTMAGKSAGQMTVAELAASKEYQVAVAAARANATNLLTTVASCLKLRGGDVPMKVDVQASVDRQKYMPPLRVVPDTAYVFNQLEARPDGTAVYRDLQVKTAGLKAVWVRGADNAMHICEVDQTRASAADSYFPVTTAASVQSHHGHRGEKLAYSRFDGGFAVATAAMGRRMATVPTELTPLAICNSV